MREIAKACGCNDSTVSRALSNKPVVAPATRQRILGIAKKMGWKPNFLASAYMAHFRSTRTPKYQANLAYVISFTAHELAPFRDVQRPGDLPHFMRLIIKGAEERAAALGFKLETIWLRDFGFNFDRLARMLKTRGIPGVVLHGGSLAADAFCAFDCDSFALATWGYSVTEPRMHRAAFDWNQGTQMTLRNIRQRGYRRIALIISNRFDKLTNRTLASTFYYAEKHPSEKESLMSLVFPEAEPGAKKMIKAWVRQHAPDVIIGTVEARQAVEEMGWRIPEDVAFVTPHQSSLWPKMGGLDQLPEVTGANAIDLVSAQLNRNEWGLPALPKLLLNEGRWVEGQSIPSREEIRPRTGRRRQSRRGLASLP